MPVPPTILEGRKRPKFGAIFDNFRVCSESRKSTSSTTLYNPSYVRRKKFVNFGPLTKSYVCSCWSTQMDFFGRLHFCPLGCCPLKFFYMRYSFLNCISSRTCGVWRPHVGLCTIFQIIFLHYDKQKGIKLIIFTSHQKCNELFFISRLNFL